MSVMSTETCRKIVIACADAGFLRRTRTSYGTILVSSNGKLEQITQGPTTQENMFMAPDGKSLVAAVGTTQYTAYFHDKDGDTPLSLLGPVVTLVTNVGIFGLWGIPMWLGEMAWIPFFAAGVINGLGHWWGYRNFETPDNSRNLPGNVWALLTCGESLHNNHHHVQNSPRFAARRSEIDLGYRYFRILRALGLARETQARHAAAGIG